MGRVLLSTAFGFLAFASPAVASMPLSDANVKSPTLEVNARGEALISYTRENGQPRHVLLGPLRVIIPTADP